MPFSCKPKNVQHSGAHLSIFKAKKHKTACEQEKCAKNIAASIFGRLLLLNDYAKSQVILPNTRKRGAWLLFEDKMAHIYKIDEKMLHLSFYVFHDYWAKEPFILPYFVKNKGIFCFPCCFCKHFFVTHHDFTSYKDGRIINPA